MNVYEVLAAGRCLSSPENEARWEALLCMLESVRCESDLQQLRREIPMVPFRDDPRVHWLLDFCTRLEAPNALSDWDGIVRYEK